MSVCDSRLAAQPLSVAVSARGDTVLAVLRGELDLITVTAFSRALAQMLRGEPGRLELDLAGLSFIDCAGARALAEVCRARPAGQRAVLRSPSSSVCRLLLLLGLGGHVTAGSADPEPSGPL